jgi:hypothetical protein
MSTRSTRYPVQVRVIFTDGRQDLPGAIYDVSETGMFIETSEEVALGTRVRIQPLATETVAAFEIEGEVVRRSDAEMEKFGRVPGIGIRFANVTPHALWALRKLFETATWSKP